MFPFPPGYSTELVDSFGMGTAPVPRCGIGAEVPSAMEGNDKSILLVSRLLTGSGATSAFLIF